MTDTSYRNPPEALILQGTASSGVGLALGEAPVGIVHVELTVRRNHGHAPDDTYDVHLGANPDLAMELGRYLIAASKAARRDLTRFLATGDATDG